MNDLKDIIIEGLIILWLGVWFCFLALACLLGDFSILMIFVRVTVLITAGILVVMLTITVYRLAKDLAKDWPIKLKKYITESDNNSEEEE